MERFRTEVLAHINGDTYKCDPSVRSNLNSLVKRTADFEWYGFETYKTGPTSDLLAAIERKQRKLRMHGIFVLAPARVY
eukprot:450648-Pleurochrysis_carterae.AAC.3